MSTKSIVPRANQEGSIGTSSKHWGQIFIDNPASGSTAAMVLTTRTTSQNALLITGECRDTDLIRGVNATFTTGAGLNLANTYVTGDTQSANSVVLGNGFKGTGTSTFKNLFIDSNKTTATAVGKTADIYGIHVDADDTSTNVGTVNSYGVAINNNFTSAGGTVNAYGLYTNIAGGDTNYDIYMENPLDSSEFAALRVGNGGELIISTASDDTTGDITLDADGDIELNADGGDIVFKDDSSTLATISSQELDFPLNFTLDVGGDIEFNADGGDFTFKDDATTIANINATASFIPTVEYVRVLGYTNALNNAHVYGPDISQGSTSHAWADKLFDDGATAEASDPGKAIQAAQLVAGRAGYVRDLKGWIAGTNGQTITFRVFKATPTDSSSSALALTELGQSNGIDTAMDGTNASTRISYNAAATTDLSSATAAFAEGDLILVGLQNSDTTAMTSRFALTMEVVYTATS